MNKKKALLTGFCLAVLVMLVIGASIDYRALNPTQFTTNGIVTIKSGATVTNLTIAGNLSGHILRGNIAIVDSVWATNIVDIGIAGLNQVVYVDDAGGFWSTTGGTNGDVLVRINDIPTWTNQVVFDFLSLDEPLPLSVGGLGSVLLDPNANALLGWNNVNKSNQFVLIGSGLTFDGTNLTATGGADGTVSNLNTLTANLPVLGNGAGQLKSVSVASNHYVLGTTNFVELEQVKWRATRQRKPWIGFDTFYSSWNGSNTAAGMAVGGATNNIYCDPSDEFCSIMMTNMIESGLHARGLNLISINDGWQCAKGGRVGGVITVNSNKFPNGMLAFVNKAHALGYKVRLYNDITPAGSCCGLEPFTNVVVDAQTLVDWKIDALTIDTCGAGGTGGSDDAKRDLHLNFIAALKNVGWNGSYEVHFNVGQTTEQYTNYFAQWPLMQNTFQHTREWGDLYGGVTNWWGEALDHIDLIQHVMGGLRPGHHPQMGYLDAQSQDGYIQGAQWSTLYHFGWMNYFMQAMHQSDLIFSLDYTAHPFVNNRRFQTNDYLYRIQQDNFYDPPTKIVINGDCEIWSKHLDDGSVAFSIINRAISVSSLGNHFATTPQSIDLNLRGFGAGTNNSFMVDCINFTNRTVTDTTTFTCATNTFQQWIWYPEKHLTIPRGNLIIQGTNQNGPGMVKLLDASASGGATILRSDGTGLSVYDGNNSARANVTAANLSATTQIIMSDGSVRIRTNGIAILNPGHATIDSTNNVSVDTDAGNNSFSVGRDGVTRAIALNAQTFTVSTQYIDTIILTNWNSLFDAVTNAWTANTPLILGSKTNFFLSSAAATIGITGIAELPTSTERYGQLTILATGTVVFTNAPGIKSSDFLTSRTITSGNSAVIAIDVIPGRTTNMAFAQFQ